MISCHETKWKKFPPETLQLLFTAIEEDDAIGEGTTLPDDIDIPFNEEHILNSYSLCLQFWEDGVKRAELLALVNKVMQDADVIEKDRMQYKYIRARYKHLRFAQRLYSNKHEADILFRQVTVFLGHFQDAFRNNNRRNIFLYGVMLRLFLTKPLWKLVHYHLRQKKLDTAAGFARYRQGQIRKLRSLLAKGALTGEEFHDVRKIISQQVSYYDSQRSLEPDQQSATRISGFLANINGLMGDRHDEMVADKLSGRKSYDEPTQLADNIRQPIELFLASYPA